jgi:hypothetical protein
MCQAPEGFGDEGTEDGKMEKMRYPVTREPLDLDNFIANFVEDYEESETMQMVQLRQAPSAVSQHPHRSVGAGH